MQKPGTVSCLFVLLFLCLPALNLFADPKKVLVTGATGFVGSHVIERLLSQGIEVRVLVRDPAKLGAKRSRVEVVEGDITDPATVCKSVKGVDAIVHTAAFVSDYSLDPFQFEQVNIRGTDHLLSAARREARDHPLRLVHFSTVDVLRHARGEIIDDSAPYETQSPYLYPRTKIEAEKLVFNSWQKAQETGNKGFEVTAVRPTWIYGPRDRTFIPGLIKALRAGTPVLIGGREKTLHLNYIENLLDVVWLLLTRSEAVGKAFISDDGAKSWGWIVDQVSHTLDIKRPKLSLPLSMPSWCGWVLSHAMENFAYLIRSEERPDLTPYVFDYMFQDLHYSAKRLEEIFGYTPRVPIEEGMKKTLETFR